MSTSWPTISLLSEPSISRQPPTTFLASAIIHGAVIALVYFAFLFAPRIDTHAVVHYDMRQIDLFTPEDNPSRLAAGGVRYPGPISAEKSRGSNGDDAAHRPSPKLIPHAAIGPQTLLQPDLKTSVALDKAIPLPKVVLWTPSSVPVKQIVAPKPQKPPTADVNPTLDMPNQEVNLADIPLASTSKLAVHPLVQASNTSPIVIQQPQQQPQAAPSTTSQTAAQPTPATVMSLSDIRMNANVKLPPVNETASGDLNGSLTVAQPLPLPGPGNENATEKKMGAGDPRAAGTHPGSGTAAPGGGDKNNAGGNGNSQGNSTGAGLSQTPGSGTGSGDRATSTRIALPPDGRFGAVVVGTSLQDEFPEMGNVWNGRMAYTVYLHVGLAKAWILQYSLPRNTDADSGGAASPLVAPWPFNIVRPNLAPGSIDTDALLVHGFINSTGRFEGLEVVFPPAFPQAQFVLQALSEWQFRPAAMGGKPARVEVVIVIPDEDE